ncbi:hypothetical protein QWJ26_19400 [Streptomyces sp. CSDS2]|uniref:hypothetical protein n=1 Tax=Streptomyces sp. CSDS2 TaxID=3055051 RepID=UPI0025B1206E|nr:hypothetical protein [Streptomyces sp. CSDS2]MDN3261937.1 hypothetical protein [Streptomyces sp. CSDS2]
MKPRGHTLVRHSELPSCVSALARPDTTTARPRAAPALPAALTAVLVGASFLATVVRGLAP